MLRRPSTSDDGSKLYASAGGNEKIREYDFKEGPLMELKPVTVGDTRGSGFYPAGIVVSPDGSKLFVAAA